MGKVSVFTVCFGACGTSIYPDMAKKASTKNILMAKKDKGKV